MPNPKAKRPPLNMSFKRDQHGQFAELVIQKISAMLPKRFQEFLAALAQDSLAKEAREILDLAIRQGPEALANIPLMLQICRWLDSQKALH